MNNYDTEIKKLELEIAKLSKKIEKIEKFLKNEYLLQNKFQKSCIKYNRSNETF